MNQKKDKVTATDPSHEDLPYQDHGVAWFSVLGKCEQSILPDEFLGETGVVILFKSLTIVLPT